ncbi:MAG: hypothetical protein GY851_35525 [bacterium]|nr:hypothetical protein [bacterium]
MASAINNAVIISDIHCGCKLGLCTPIVNLDEGGSYHASALQLKLLSWWQEFWSVWVPEATHGEPYAVVVNGDSTDGVHHKSVTQISNNLTDQKRIAADLLRPIVASAAAFYMIRGTEAHVGASGQNEEALAQELGAIPNESGQYARYELWLRIGRGLAHIMHHIGTTGRTHYESSALMGEYGESCADAGRWGREAPDVVVRSHRHRNCEIRVPTKDGYGICCTTPGWQLRTPFAYRIPGGRITTPQMGGTVIRCGDNDVFTRHKVWSIERSKVEEPTHVDV